MKRRTLLAGLLFSLLMACTAIAPAAIPPTETPLPIFTSTPTFIPPSATPIQLTLRVTDELINCRYGPGVVYAFVNDLSEGQSAHVIGRNQSSTWWYIRDPGNPGGSCWVSAQVTQIKGDTENLPITDPPLITATNIKLRIEPPKIFVACDQFPQTIFFEAEVTTNGPLVVVWRLESSAGYMSAENMLIFEESGMKLVNGYYQVPVAGDYWIKLHILKPNDVIEQLNFPANCAP